MNVYQRIINSFMHGPIYILFFGFIFFAIGAGMSYHQYNLERNGAQARGEVIALSESCDDEGCTYTPVVRFQTPGGKPVTFESSFSSSPPSHEVGEQVTVLYPTGEPEKADIKGEGKVFRIIFTVVGGVTIIFGMWLFFKMLKDSNSTG